MKLNHRVPSSPLAALLTIVTIAGVGCSGKTMKEQMEQAAQMLCKAARLGLAPPDAAFEAYAAKMGVTAQALKKSESGRHVVGTEALAQYIKAQAPKLPAKARREFAHMFGAVASVDPKRKLELLKAGFKDHGVTLDCAAVARYWGPRYWGRGNK